MYNSSDARLGSDGYLTCEEVTALFFDRKDYYAERVQYAEWGTRCDQQPCATVTDWISNDVKHFDN
jgi:hypothetical protein